MTSPSPVSKLIKSNAHEPFKSRACDSCHAPAGSAGEVNLLASKEKLCFTCHPDKEKMAADPVVHYPVKAGDCTGCHNPHASSAEKFVHARGEKLCYLCHADKTDISERKFQHKPLADNSCKACHAPTRRQTGVC
jgi:predicted CXXCH cytochrome family protein